MGSTKREAGLPQHRSIDVGDATLECKLCGSGAPVVLLANAGCSIGYFDQLARTLVTGGFQTISINTRGEPRLQQEGTSSLLTRRWRRES